MGEVVHLPLAAPVRDACGQRDARKVFRWMCEIQRRRIQKLRDHEPKTADILALLERELERYDRMQHCLESIERQGNPAA
jgi:hypothetical protein